MNNNDRSQLAKLDIRVGNIEKAVESIKTNDLPHINQKLASIKEEQSSTRGKLSLLIPLTIGTFVAILGVVATILIVVI